MHKMAMHTHAGAQACSAGTYLRTRTGASPRVRLTEHARRVSRAPGLAELSAPAPWHASGRSMDAHVVDTPSCSFTLAHPLSG